MRIKLTGVPKLKLLDLLRRRKTTLKKFIDESAIWTYDSLLTECKRLGVSPPLRHEVIDVFPVSDPPKTSDPPEGIVVIDAWSTDQASHEQLVLSGTSDSPPSDPVDGDTPGHTKKTTKRRKVEPTQND